MSSNLVPKRALIMAVLVLVLVLQSRSRSLRAVALTRPILIPGPGCATTARGCATVARR